MNTSQVSRLYSLNMKSILPNHLNYFRPTISLDSPLQNIKTIWSDLQKDFAKVWDLKTTLTSSWRKLSHFHGFCIQLKLKVFFYLVSLRVSRVHRLNVQWIRPILQEESGKIQGLEMWCKCKWDELSGGFRIWVLQIFCRLKSDTCGHPWSEACVIENV